MMPNAPTLMTAFGVAAINSANRAKTQRAFDLAHRDANAARMNAAKADRDFYTLLKAYNELAAENTSLKETVEELNLECLHLSRRLKAA